MTDELHVIFGAGQVGQPLARRLQQAGKRVRVARRSASEVAEDIDIARGDAADPGFCIEAAAGAATVYHCMNPSYDSAIWAERVPLYMENLITATARAKARLVVLDNVYMLGRSHGQPLSEETSPNPCSRKGEIRARAAERLFEAHGRGDVLATTGRASDFYGPGGALTHVGDQFWPRALAGKTVWSLVRPDAIHTYHYIPDVAAGLATLGCAGNDAYGRPWMLPCAPAETLRDLGRRLSRALGAEIAIAGVPRALVKAVGLAVPIVREVAEMLYQWEEPFVIDDRRFRMRFGQGPSDTDEAAAATVAWARQHYK